MPETIAIGIQNFDKLREENYFYIDKTSFIRDWWERGDDVTLIARPRRFGKTLNMSMIEAFFLWIMQEEKICLKVFLFGGRRNIVPSREPIQ